MMGDNHSESQETTSSSSEDSLNISFENINFTVRNHIFSKERKVILSNLSGTFKAGDLTVIVGQSGAGKSTLMDILAGYTKPTSGTIYVNGRIRDEKKFRRRSCYILQDDKVQEMLTVSESLAIAAELKLGNHVSKQQKEQRVEEIIISLTLNDARNTRAGNLSGGQKKRLAIGLELVSDPPVMFLDEPISGLDSSTSKYTVNLLHLLARQGRTVVITMHQPSPVLLQMVDRLYAVVAGRCAYMGLEKQLLPYLEQLNLECPKHYNTVDFLIEISMDNADELVRLSRNGQNTDWTSVTPQKTDYNLAETSNLIIRKDIYLTTLPAPKEDPTNKILSKLKSTYSTSFWRQFVTLTRRALLTIWRNPSLTYMITGIHCAMALFIGFLFYNIGEDAKYFRQNFNFLYFSLMFLMYTAFSVVSINFPEQFPVVRREHFNRWYSTGAYYAASLVSALPTQTVCTLAYTFIAYWLTGQPCDPVRFFGFCWTVLMVSYVALCLGLLNGAMFNVKHAVIFGPFFVMPFVVFSGFFLYYNDAPFYLKWLFHVSFLKYGLAGLVISIIGLDRPKLPCSILYCHYAYPKQFLMDTGMIHDTFSIVVVALYSILFVIILCTYFVLKIRLKRKW